MPPPDLHDINIRSPNYLIARTNGVCWHCLESTRLIALALPQDHETLNPDPDTDTEGGELAADTWQLAKLNAFVFYVEYLPQAVRNRLLPLSPFYRLARSAPEMSSYWSNHCEVCGSLQGDHELFCEPGGAFTPANENAAAAIELMRVDAPFEAAAAGYAYQPEFFEFMRGS